MAWYAIFKKRILRKKSSLALPNASISAKLSAFANSCTQGKEYFPAEDNELLLFAVNYLALKKISIDKEK